MPSPAGLADADWGAGAFGEGPGIAEHNRTVAALQLPAESRAANRIASVGRA